MFFNYNSQTNIIPVGADLQPNVPSAKDLTETDEYNLSIADMQKIQMEKIKEFYLYIVQQQKDIEALKQKNAELEKKLK